MDLKHYYAAVTMAWKYFKKYEAMLPLSKDQWQQAIEEGRRISASFPKEYELFISEELITKINELERLDKKAKEATNE